MSCRHPQAVSATGMAHVEGSQVNTAYLTLFFENSIIAHMHVNWLAPVKLRQTLIGGSKKMIVWDDLEPSEKIKVYDKGITLENDDAVFKARIGYRSGDMWAPQLDPTEALRDEAVHFIQCVEEGKPSRTDGHAGLRVVEIAEAATRSLQEQGRPIELKHRKDVK
jgi:predicted dehydrogenase